jgi:hypothetical protein
VSARAFGYMLKAPRAWAKILPAVEELLTDEATILRRVKTGQGQFGSPMHRQDTYGPYAAKLEAKQSQDQRAEDRHVVQTSYQLAIASDVEPSEGDRIRVTEEGGRTRTFRIPGTVNHRRSMWGATPVWNVELQITTEA